MKRIKTSNILIITSILIIFIYILGIVIAVHSVLKKYQNQQGGDMNFYNSHNTMQLTRFSTIVVSDHNSVKLSQDNSYKISTSSENISYRIHGDTLWVNCDAMVSAPVLNSIVANDNAVVYASLNIDTLNLYSDENATIILKDSRIKKLEINSSDKARIVVTNTPIGKANLKLMDGSKVKLLTTVDTLAGYTASGTSLTISQVKVKEIKTDGSLTIMKITHSVSPIQIEIEN